jgi:peptidoglycan/xylan/chitin deacetylase (PgdA/CDA1 family)
MSSRLFRIAAQPLSPAGRRARLTVLIYHRVLAAPDPLQPDVLDAAAFDAQLKLLRGCFQVMPLTQAVEGLKDGKLPARSACITFDDGYADNLTQALPILQQNHLTATFFIATDYLDGGRMFNDTVIEAVRRAPAGEHDLRDLGLGCYRFSVIQDRIDAIGDILPRVKYLSSQERTQRVADIANHLKSGPLPDDLMLSTEQLRALHGAGMEIGAHTASHPILATLSDEDAETDIARGQARLEQILKTEIRLFAYPNGKPGVDYTSRDVALVRKLGFVGAVSTAWGTADCQADRYQLPRFLPWSRSPARFTLQMLQNLLRRPS